MNGKNLIAAEGNEKGPFFSFKGFDNRIYYMLTLGGFYYSFIPDPPQCLWA